MKKINAPADDIVPDLSRHNLSSARIGLSLYRLLSHVLASKPFSVLGERDALADLSFLASHYEQSEVIHLLTEVAIHIRITDERFRNEFPVEMHIVADAVVGKLWQPVSSRSSVALSLREACNKIVHAEKITFTPDGSERHWGTSISHNIYVFGQYRKHSWRASVDLTHFVANAFGLIEITWHG